LLDIADINRESFDLSMKNPNKTDEAQLRERRKFWNAIAVLDAESAEILMGIGGML